MTFRLATSVFRDPLALTVYDDEHSEAEERWATLGQADNGHYLVVIHTWKHQSPKEIAVRIVSARRATKRKCEITRSSRASGRRCDNET